MDLIHSANQAANPPLAMLQMASTTVLNGLKTDTLNPAVVSSAYLSLSNDISAIATEGIFSVAAKSVFCCSRSHLFYCNGRHVFCLFQGGF